MRSWSVEDRLEKLLCREEFTSHGMVSPKNMEDVITDWEGCFQRVKVLLDKYRLMEDRQIGRIASWVMEHVDEKVTLENVAAGVYMNPTYVSHIFKKVSGINLADYIVDVKTDRAKVLLQIRITKRRTLQLQSVIPVPNIFPEYSERRQVSHQLSGKKTGTVCREIDTSF